MQETRVWSLDQEDPLEKEMATPSGIFAWEIPCAEEPGRLQSMGLQRVRYDLTARIDSQGGPPNRRNSCLDLTQLDDLFCSNKDLLLLTCRWVLGWPDHGQTWKRSKLGTKNENVYMSIITIELSFGFCAGLCYVLKTKGEADGRGWGG